MNWKQAFALGLIAPGAWDGGEQWETLFEGEATFVAYPVTGEQYAAFTRESLAKNVFLGVESGARIRLTIDGQSKVYPLTISYNSGAIGNTYLSNRNITDDGFGLYVAFGGIESSAVQSPYTRFHTYTTGTHTVKIERLVS